MGREQAPEPRRLASRRNRLALGALLVAAASLFGCGYALVGRGSALPESIRSVSVPVFRNSTQRPGIEQWVTEAVAREIASRGGLSVVAPEGAHARLEGEVTSYSAWPATFDTSGRAVEYQIIISASVRLVRRSGEEILRISDYRFQEPYAVGSSRGDAASDLENLAIEELSSRFAQGLVAAVVDGF